MAEKKKIGLVCSTFDLLHPGHVAMLEDAKEYCDELWCALQTDVRDRPEKNRPVQTTFSRWKQLQAVKWVDKIIPYDNEADLLNLIRTLPPHVRILGKEYFGKEWTGKSCYAYEDVVYLQRTHDYSTSKLRADVWLAENMKEMK